MLGVSYVMTFYVDACALVYFQFHPRSVGRSVGRLVDRSVGRSVSRSVGRSVDPGTTSRHFGAETKNLIVLLLIPELYFGGGQTPN